MLKRELASKISTAIQILSLVISCSIVASAQSAESTSVLSACEGQFGPLLDNKENLLEINALYVLQVRFDPQGRLSELALLPKYYLQDSHPEWKRPQPAVYLSNAEYEGLLARLEKVRSKGKLIKSTRNPMVNDFTLYTHGQYEHAFLRRAEMGKDEVLYVRLYFSREIEGKVERKRRYNFSGMPRALEDYHYLVSVGKLHYFVREEDYRRLRVGRTAKFVAFGPVHGVCDERNCNP